ncbi:MAG: oligosaccharide flippase family protein [Bacilli bacterium]|nr:oligosaccharide flippase family protein [Bacilli bacterium]
MKNVFLKSTIILIIGTLITKIIGFFIKIVATRILGNSYYIYTLIMPTYSLLITITQLGLPNAISTIISKSKYKSIHVLSSIIPISLLFNIFIMSIVIVFADNLAIDLLKNPDTYYPIIALTGILPFTCISGIIKGYFFGKQNMIPNAMSNIIEQFIRLMLTVLIVPIFVKLNPILAVSVYILTNAITEIVQIFIYLLFMPNKTNIKLRDLKPKIPILNEILSISIPTLTGRIFANICYFLEPIILTNILLFVGYSSEYITTEYGIYNAYVIPMLTMFSFFCIALNTTLIPEISKNYRSKTTVKKKLRISLIISLGLGIVTSLITFTFGESLLHLIYNTDNGVEYLRVLSIFFFAFYLEGPLNSTLIALELSNYSMKVTISTCIIKLIILSILSFTSIGIYGLIISEIVDIYLVVILNSKKLHKLGYL